MDSLDGRVLEKFWRDKTEPSLKWLDAEALCPNFLASGNNGDQPHRHVVMDIRRPLP
jgi:hypothetical protein